jgi:outer membrane scaffolding protein for murein synthesis (MipA/OmpV family)
MSRLGFLTVAAAASAALWAGQAQAADDDWTVDLGAAGRVRPTHLGSARYTDDVVPIVEAQFGDRVTLSFDDGAKWAALRMGPVDIGPIAEYRQSFNDDAPRGAYRMGDAIELGGFASAKTPVGVAEVRLRRAVTGYDGWSGDLSFSSGAPITPRLSLSGQLRASWADANFTDEYFGLKPHAARRFGLPEILDEDYITAGGELDLIAAVTPRMHLVLALSEDRIVSELRPSPLFSSRDIATASLGLTWRWTTRRASGS